MWVSYRAVGLKDWMRYSMASTNNVEVEPPDYFAQIVYTCFCFRLCVLSTYLHDGSDQVWNGVCGNC